MQKTVQNVGGISDSFGNAVAISNDGNTIIVGCKQDDTGAYNGGSIIVFTSNNITTWVENETLAGTSASAYLGHSVALSSAGNVAIAGAYLDTIGGNNYQGSATVFYRR